MWIKILLVIIFLFGAFLRFHNISPFKIYPDAYENLLIAQNIITYHRVVGYLGPEGMSFPPFFMWTRPVYPLLINITNIVTNDMTRAAQTISFLGGVFAIPLTFLFIKKVFIKTSYALAAALLLTLSFNHTIWSGFIMTEAIGVFFMLFFLFSFFATIKQKPTFTRDFLTGICFTLAMMSRYEYAITLLPVGILIFLFSPSPWKRLSSIIGGTLICTIIFIQQLFPLQGLFSIVWIQQQDLLKKSLIVVCIFLAIIVLYHWLLRHVKKSMFAQLYKIVLILFSFLLIFFFTTNEMLRTFIRNDILISIYTIIGLLLFLRKDSLQTFGLFVIGSIIPLAIIYYHVNPAMDRYYTHLLPFLLIPASYGLVSVLKTKHPIAVISFLVIAFIQIMTTYQGLKPSQDTSWYRTSYEEKAAQKVRPYITNENQLLIVSQPEPYSYITHASIHSVTNSPPFVYLNDEYINQKVIVVLDMGMYEIFPSFADLITSKLQNHKIAEFWIKEKYHYTNNIYEEKYPVKIYKLTLRELKQKIAL
jgi:hypothetical protein